MEQGSRCTMTDRIYSIISLYLYQPQLR
ncbi:UNVERIFIED_CONTAM: hypothetical protein GTU68_054278 [Idotea baltica]|nr:hypothetical protein [Idotea baltica]